MNKVDYVNRISEKLKLTKKDVGNVINELFELMKEDLKNNEKIMITNFGTFETAKTKPYNIRYGICNIHIALRIRSRPIIKMQKRKLCRMVVDCGHRTLVMRPITQ